MPPSQIGKDFSLLIPMYFTPLRKGAALIAVQVPPYTLAQYGINNGSYERNAARYGVHYQREDVGQYLCRLILTDVHSYVICFTSGAELFPTYTDDTYGLQVYPPGQQGFVPQYTDIVFNSLAVHVMKSVKQTVNSQGIASIA